MVAGAGTQRRNKIRDEHGDRGAAVRFVLFMMESVCFVPIGVGWDVAGYQGEAVCVDVVGGEGVLVEFCGIYKAIINSKGSISDINISDINQIAQDIGFSEEYTNGSGKKVNVVRTRVDIKVKMCWVGCERRVNSSVSGLK
ncbi:hypothetical protein Droror1_Dr00008403, partial [Drosera rotundifolia]